MKHNDVTIRKAKDEDLTKIYEIYLEGIEDEILIQYPRRKIEDIRADIKKDEKERIKNFIKGINSKYEYWVVALEGKNIAGFGQISIEKKNKEKSCLEKVYVVRNKRGNGIGKKISKELLIWAKKKKAKSVFSRLFIKNKHSIKMHKGLGFDYVSIGMEMKL